MATKAQKTWNSTRIKALALLLLFGFQVFVPSTALALTGGPEQPEFSGFTPIDSSNMVDPFSGDFNYNIPLLDIEGYPINLAYSSTVSPEQEASWVGLGWSLNPGTINRTTRGIPDDFEGSNDKIQKEFKVKKNWTAGLSASASSIEAIGIEIDFKNFGIGAKAGVYYNNYKGFGTHTGVTANASGVLSGKFSGQASVGFGHNSQEGLEMPSLSLAVKQKRDEDNMGGYTNRSYGLNIIPNYNTRYGIQSLKISPSISNDQYKKVGNKDERISGRTYSATGRIPIGTQTYTPSQQMPTRTVSANLDVSFGPEFFWTTAELALGGSYTETTVPDASIFSPAYGYMYSHLGRSEVNAIHDFNREKDGTYSPETPAIPLTNQTYDIFSASGQGISGAYRLHRSDVGVVYDAKIESKSEGGNLGLEFGVAQLVKLGGNVGYNFSNSYSGNWTEAHIANTKFGFSGEKNDNQYRPAYFKKAGTITAVDDNYLKICSGFGASNFEMGGTGRPMSTFKNSEYGRDATIAQINGTRLTNRKVSRTNDPQPFQVLTHAERAKTGFMPVASIDVAADGTTIPAPAATTYFGKPNHISEAKVIREDGFKFYYGIPVYNYIQREVTFNCSGNSFVSGTDKVTYSSAANNGNGLDNYYSAVTTPASVQSLLLTAVVSPDYADATGDGPTTDDVGTYTKFEYKRVHGGSEADGYKWRSPEAAGTANFNEGFASDKNDDKGTYTYGSKDVWYVKRIKSKNYVAEFHMTPRSDAYGVMTENGGFNWNKALYKLDKIVLYSITDRELNKDKAIPIKTVHFEYDYQLCKGVLNSNLGAGSNGKLTLRKVYFTYENSRKGELNPYKFYYDKTEQYNGNAIHPFADATASYTNPAYGVGNMDRWGVYKPSVYDPGASIQDRGLNNVDFPFTSMQKETADMHAQAWLLNAIKLPSGGLVQIDYEADDYAYVQAEKAMQMYRIMGFRAKATDHGYTAKLFDEGFAVIEVPPGTTAAQFERCLEGVKQLYFKVLCDISGKGNYEYVTGYCEIVSASLVRDGEGVIQLKQVDISDRAGSGKANPISKMAWQTTRLYFPQFVRPGSSPTTSSDAEVAIRSLVGFFQDLIQAFRGINASLRARGVGNKFVPSKSFVRLRNPDGFKYGGGARVKRLLMHDQWKEMAGTSYKNSAYGSEYTYTTQENGKTISSGVAEWEPFVGGEDNPNRLPVLYNEKNRFAPDNAFMQETPFGESFLPNPNVGYSKVTVKQYKPDNVTKGIGSTVTEFYTAKDFPALTHRTGQNQHEDQPGFLTSLLNINVVSEFWVSQGFVVELNNMHGVMKSESVYAEGNATPVSSVTYNYKSEEIQVSKLSQRKVKHLVSTVDGLNNRGVVIPNTTVATDVDMVIDLREMKSQAYSFRLGLNLDASLFPFLPIPIPIPMVTGGYSNEQDNFHSTGVTKVITRYGILDNVVSMDLQSSITTTNLLYDTETGKPVLTVKQNRFEDPIYTFNLPAYWAYPNMGSASGNYKYAFAQLNLAGSIISGTNQWLQDGDVLLVGKTDPVKYWVEQLPNGYKVVDENGVGALGSSLKDVIVVSSGAKNQLTENVMTVISKNYPVQGGKLNFRIANVLEASAVEKKNYWPRGCNCDPVELGKNKTLTGQTTTWKNYRSYAYLVDRKYTDQVTKKYQLRQDGVYNHSSSDQFKAMWEYSDKWRATVSSVWKYASETTMLNRIAQEVESKDALGNYSTRLFAFKESLPKAVSVNAKNAEVGVEDFEDYDPTNCASGFGFTYPTEKRQRRAHTGRYCLKVSANEKITSGTRTIKCGND